MSLDSLSYPLEVAEGSFGQARVAAQSLAGLYNGDDFPLSLADFRRLDDDLLEHCMEALRLGSRLATEVHRYFPNGKEIIGPRVRWGGALFFRKRRCMHCRLRISACSSACRVEYEHISCRSTVG